MQQKYVDKLLDLDIWTRYIFHNCREEGQTWLRAVYHLKGFQYQKPEKASCGRRPYADYLSQAF